MQNVITLLTQNVITFFTSKGAWSTRVGTLHLVHRLRVVPHFSSGIVGRAKREHAWKSPHERKGDTRRGERKMRDCRQSPSFWPFTADWFRSVKFVSRSKSIKRIQWDSFSHWAVIALVIGKVQGIFIASERKPRHKFSSRLHFSLSPSRVAFSRVGWFSRALAFRSPYYPWGKLWGLLVVYLVQSMGSDFEAEI